MAVDNPTGVDSMLKAKNILERLEALENRGKMSGVAVLSELQELIDKAPAALLELHQLEMDLERGLNQ